MRALLVAPLLLLVPLAASLAPPVAPVTHAACPGAPAPVLFAAWETQLENLAFHEGRLLVSDIGGDRLLTFDASGALLDATPVPGMHGVTVGPEGAVYVGASGAGGVEVWRLGEGAPEVVATELPAANGLAFDAAGNLFVSSPLTQAPPYLVRLPAGDMGAWETWGDQYGTNGLWLDGDSLLAAVTADQSSPILRISTSDPDDVAVVAQLSLGVATLQPGAHAPAGQPTLLPKGLDDLTLAPDGMIYAAAHVAGEVLRVDPASGAACVLASGLEEPTSVRVAQGFGAWDGQLFVTDMGGVAVTALAGPGAGAVWALDIR